MLYEAIRLGCQIYHECQSAYDRAYVDYLRDKDQLKWDHPERLDAPEIGKLREFLNVKFGTRMQLTYERERDALQHALQSKLSELNMLRSITILSADFNDKKMCRLIIDAFDTVAQYHPDGNKYTAVATSKILHTINPGLFVMWDNAIQCGYGLSRSNKAKGYVCYFLPRIQRLVRLAIRQEEEVSDNTIESFRSPRCTHSIARLLDEYNYTKFTVNCDSVWKKEYES